MPGAELYVNLAIEKGLALPETKQIVGYFVPVIFVQKGNPKKIRALQDLTQSGLRIGIGDPRACAVGKKTIKILEKNGLYQSIKKNIVYKSATVNELGLAIQLKTVDAVILWDANVQHFLSYGEAVPIPVEQNIPSRIPIVLLKASKYPREAQAFINFATSEEGKKILRECGYTVSLKVKDT
jgi:molybdate transport system substrate-binding protein